MADAAPKTHINSASDHANPSKFFMYKAALVTVFLVLLPLFPSLAPDFINQTLHARSWELLQLIFVGIAVSYGLFSKKNDESHKDNPSSKIDNAQSYVSKLLQVSSVFDDESDNHTVIEENKFQALNSQYYRGEPVVVVAKENPDVDENNGVVSQISQKPLLLPVRSLKQRVPEVDSSDMSRTSSKRFSTSSRKSSRAGEVGGLNVVDKMEEKVVLRSPIPWRSRSGRMEMMKENGDEITSFSVSEQELNRVECRSFRSSRPNALSPSTSFSSESQSKGGEDVVRKKSFVSPPPAPPPPPSPLRMKSSSSVGSNAGLPEKALRRSVSEKEIEMAEMDEVELRFGGQNEKKKELVEKVLVETSDEEEETEGESEEDDKFEVGRSSGNVGGEGDDVGPDVDKKADEFIAKFREQIRLQRIESIRRSTAQRAGKSLR